MKIIVAVKQVTERDAPVRIAGKWIDKADLQFATNESDVVNAVGEKMKGILKPADSASCRSPVESVGAIALPGKRATCGSLNRV